RFLYGDPVGQQATQPALVHVEHRAALRLFGNCVLSLALGAYEEDDSAVRSQILHKFRRFLEHLQRLLQIDNVDPVALTNDELLHLGVPSLGLVPEVNACFEQLLHRDIRQSTSSVGLHPLCQLSAASCQLSVRSTGNWLLATGNCISGLPFPSTPPQGRWGDEFYS